MLRACMPCVREPACACSRMPCGRAGGGDVGEQLDWASGLTHIRQIGLILIRQVETVGPQDLNLLFRLHVVLSTELSVFSVYRFVLYDSGTLSVIVSVPCVSLVLLIYIEMEATVMSDEIERESTRPRENPAPPVLAIRRVTYACSPHAYDPTHAACMDPFTRPTL